MPKPNPKQTSKEVLILSLGGSLIVPEDIDTKFLAKFQSLILKYIKRKNFIILCGGGKTARKYQEAINKIMNANQEDLDWIGIKATVLNANVVKTLFGKEVYSQIIQNPTEKLQIKEPILVAAGWKPGFSTDYDAVQLAKTYEVKTVINLTNVDYVYNKNPKEFKDATPIRSMSWKYFRQLVGNTWRPGLNAPFDPIASKLAQKLELKVIIANGQNLSNLEKIIEGKEFIGTVIG